MVRLLFLLSLLSLSKINEANACRCITSPLQDSFCHSEFVAKVKITSAPNYDLNSISEHEIDVLEIYKATDEAKAALERKVFESGPATCSLFFEKDQVVVIGGRVSNGKLFVGICDLNILSLEDIEAQESNLRTNFAKSCASV